MTSNCLIFKNSSIQKLIYHNYCYYDWLIDLLIEPQQKQENLLKNQVFTHKNFTDKKLIIQGQKQRINRLYFENFCKFNKLVFVKNYNQTSRQLKNFKNFVYHNYTRDAKNIVVSLDDIHKVKVTWAFFLFNFWCFYLIIWVNFDAS